MAPTMRSWSIRDCLDFHQSSPKTDGIGDWFRQTFAGDRGRRAAATAAASGFVATARLLCRIAEPFRADSVGNRGGHEMPLANWSGSDGRTADG
jgi:hypothetical protein